MQDGHMGERVDCRLLLRPLHSLGSIVVRSRADLGRRARGAAIDIAHQRFGVTTGCQAQRGAQIMRQRFETPVASQR